MTEKQDFFKFLYDYISFYEQMEQQSMNRFEVLSSYNLAGLERAIAGDESAIKLAKQMERRRIELQQLAGFENLPFRDIIGSIDGEDRVTLQRIYDRLSELLDSIKFYNEKCQNIVKSNLYKIEKATAPPPPKTTKLPDGYSGGLGVKV